jgi:hypothetical protein
MSNRIIPLDNCPAFVADTTTYGGTLVYSLQGYVGTGHYIWFNGSRIAFDPDNGGSNCFGAYYNKLSVEDKAIIKPHLDQLILDFRELDPS